MVLQCIAQSEFDPDIKYSWTKNGKPFSVDGVSVFSESSQNGNILFTSPSMVDVGTYQCEAINSFGRVFSKASLLRAQQPRDQPRRLSIDEPVAAQVLFDPTIEDKDDIERIPITQAVPEVLPTFANKPVFVVLPMTSKEQEPFLIMNMQSVNEEAEVTEQPN